MKHTTCSLQSATVSLLCRWPVMTLGVILWLASGVAVGAATKTWDGSSSGNWGTGANWTGGVAPVDGDDLLFPATASNKTCTNNIIGLSVNAIYIYGSNYVIRGNPLEMNRVVGYNPVGVNDIYIDLTIAATAINTVSAIESNTLLRLRGDVNLNNYGLYLGGPGIISLYSAITGTGIVVQNGSGITYMDGSAENTYVGETHVNNGRLVLTRTSGVISVPGPLIIGGTTNDATLRLYTDEQIAGDALVYVRTNGFFDLFGNTNTIGSLNLVDGGEVQTATGQLRLAGNVTASGIQSTSRILGELYLGNATRTFDVAESTKLFLWANVAGGSMIMPGGFLRFAGLTKTGPGVLTMDGVNTYSGTTTINDGLVVVENDRALGSTTQGTVINGGQLNVHGVQVGDESLTLNNGDNPLACDDPDGSWNGPVTLGTNVVLRDLQLIFSNSISGPYGLTLENATITYGGKPTNTYTGKTWLKHGRLLLKKLVSYGSAIPGELEIGDTNGSAATVYLYNNFQLANITDVNIHRGGLLDLRGMSERINGINGDGEMDVSGAFLGIYMTNGNSVFYGTISGTNGAIRKDGPGYLMLMGTNTWKGTNWISGGYVVVHAYQPYSAIVVEDTTNHPGFGGTGTVGDIYMQGGVLSVQRYLICSNLVMSAPSTMDIEIDDFYNYSTLVVRNSLNLGNATLKATLGFSPFEGEQFTFIVNDGDGPVVGTFAGLPNGALVPTPPLPFQCYITYGTTPAWNEVSLTFTNTLLKFVDAKLQSGNGNQVLDTNECAYLWVTLSNATELPLQNITAQLRSATPQVAATYSSSRYVSVDPGAVATNLEAFQISTQPGYSCGTTGRFWVDINTTSHGEFSFPIDVPSGSVGVGRDYASSTPYAIPDGGSVTSSIPVADFNQSVAKVTVSLHITHPSDGDLGLRLIAPDGREVILSTGNGGLGDNYGSSCAERDQTLFDDDATRSISSGTAPFVGRYRPEGELLSLRGMSGNGDWKLVVLDKVHGNVGTLQCWSLTLHPFVCKDGGGVCEICPSRKICGVISGLSPQQNGCVRTGFTNTCGAETSFTNMYPPYPVNYQAFTFMQPETNACITATLESDGPLMCTIYTNAYDPANPVLHNYANLAAFAQDQIPIHFSFRASPGINYTVVLSTQMSLSYEGGLSYTLTLSGGSCRPVLNVTPASGERMVLDWTTAAAGYALECTNALASPSAPSWPVVTNPPTIVQSRFTVTNSVAGDTNRFYQLRKP